MVTPPTRPTRYALALGRARLRWIDLATLAALAARREVGSLYIKTCRRHLAAWLPLDDYRTKFAFKLWRIEHLYKHRALSALHEQGFLQAATAHPTLTTNGQRLAEIIKDLLPAPLSEQDYAKLCSMLTDARSGRVDQTAAYTIARELVRLNAESLT